jgi:TP901 family phage tail tape measure protein
MGADTVFSANDAAGAMLELAKNGISPAVIQAGALKSALTLAAAGGVSMEEAATTMGNAINAFGLKGSQSASVAAALAGAANASSASISSLSQGLAQSATAAHQAGLSIQETTAALAAFANAGIQGSDAGTSLKTFLQRLVPQTKKARRRWRATASPRTTRTRLRKCSPRAA